MRIEFSTARARKIDAIERTKQPESTFAEDIRPLKTYQQVLWRLEREQLLQGYDPSDPESRRGRTPEIPGDNGEAIDLEELIDDVNVMEMEEENGDPTSEMMNIRKIKPLLRKIMELRTARKILNGIYAREWPTKLTEGGEGFSVHAIDRTRVEGMPPAEDDVPIIIAPGFTVGPRTTRRNAISLAELGHSVMTYAVPTNSKNFDESIPYRKDTPVYTKVHSTALLQVMKTGDTKIFEHPTKYDVIGYSFGAISTLVAADAHPEKFRNIILINPAGLTHTMDPELLERLKRYMPERVVDSAESRVRFARRFLSLIKNSKRHKKQVLNQIAEPPASLADLGTVDLTINKDKAMHTEFSQEMKEIGARGGLKEAIGVAHAISWADVLPIIERLTALGIQITILPGEDDPLFNVKSIERAGAQTGTDTFAIAGAHAQLGFYPGAISEICIDSIHHMNEKRAAEAEAVIIR